jgi:RNA polymerase sigma-70 factor (ECF subfamily)
MADIVDARQCRELVASVQAGDPQAEESLVELFGRGVALLLDRHTGGRPEAEDLYQDTFRIALEKVRTGELREPEKLPGFLSHLARNLAIEHYRKTTRRKTDTAGDDLPEVVNPDGDQLDLLVDRDNAILVRRLLGELRNARDREILARYYLAEQDRNRIADDFGLTSLQFNRVLHRARERYRVLYVARSGDSSTGSSAGVVLLLLLVTRT